MLQNIQAVGVVVADVATEYSHWTAVESLSDWCAREGVVCCVPLHLISIDSHKKDTDIGGSLPLLEWIPEQS